MYNHINAQTHIHINSGDTHNILTDTWTNKHNTNWTMNQIIKVRTCSGGELVNNGCH